jgi:hypothetical protein
LGVRYCSTESKSIQSVHPLRRSIFAMDQQKITPPHSSYVTKDDKPPRANPYACDTPT